MAGSMSDFLENAVLLHVTKGASYTQPTNLYLALFTAAPTDAGGGMRKRDEEILIFLEAA